MNKHSITWTTVFAAAALALFSVAGAPAQPKPADEPLLIMLLGDGGVIQRKATRELETLQHRVLVVLVELRQPPNAVMNRRGGRRISIGIRGGRGFGRVMV